MIRFIYGCLAVVILSFLAIPVYYGIAGERDEIQQVADNNQPDDSTLSFEEIYEIAEEGQSDADALNNIAPAAGDVTPANNIFSTGFSKTTYPGLEEETLVIIEEEILETETP